MRSFLLAFLLCLAVPLSAEDVDSLFENPTPDGEADPNAKLTQDQLFKQDIRFFESARAEGYYIAGWRGDDNEFEQSPYNALTFKFGSDARLDKNIRAYVSFYITYPKLKTESDSLYNPYKDTVPTATDLSFSNVELKEAFLDYQLADAVFLRIGRENLTWGQGRIFNPTNFVAGLGSGVGARATIGLLGLTTSLVAIKSDGYYGLEGNSLDQLKGLNTLGLAAKTEGSWGPVTGGISGFHHDNVGDKGELYLKTSLAGFDLFSEGLLERKRVKGDVEGSAVPSLLFGLYREWGGSSPWLQAQVEYLVSGRADGTDTGSISSAFGGWKDQSIGVGATSNLLNFLDTKPTLSWLHSLMDRSGQFVLGLTNTALPHLELAGGVIWIYGDTASRYVENNPDPLKRQIMITFKATFSFDIDN